YRRARTNRHGQHGAARFACRTPAARLSVRHEPLPGTSAPGVHGARCARRARRAVYPARGVPGVPGVRFP
ncbi:MAG: hypothetical protein ACRDQ1_21400, partial [Sciscionella sp.]